MSGPLLALRPRARLLAAGVRASRRRRRQPALVAARIDLHSSAGDVVADLFGRGGWVARAAVDRQRRAISLESSPLTRMLAEVVLRPPDVRHLDAAFQGMAASPRRESSLKVSLGDLYATRCATCGRMLVVDEIVVGRRPDGADPTTADAAEPRPIARHYRCTVCRDQRGGSRAAPGAARRRRPRPARRRRRRRGGPRGACAAGSPAVDGAETLVDELLALHTPRQLVGLAAILDRIESDLRAAPVLAALRLAFLHSILPASRLATAPGAHGDAADRRRPRPAARGRRSGASATRGSRSRTRSGSSAGSSSGSRAAPSARSRRASARTCGAWGRGPRPRSWRSRARRACALLQRRAGGRRPRRCRRRGSGSCSASRPVRPEPRAAGGRLPRDLVGPRARGRVAAADRRAGRAVAAARRGAGRRRPSGARSRRRPRPWPATGGRSCSWTAAPRRLAAAVLGGAGRRLPARERPAGGRRRRRRRVRRVPAAGRRPAAGAADPRRT